MESDTEPSTTQQTQAITPERAARIAALKAELAEAEGAPVEPVPVKSIVERIKELPDDESPHTFVSNLRVIAEELKADGKLVEADFLTPAEQSGVTAVLVKLVGEIAEKI